MATPYNSNDATMLAYDPAVGACDTGHAGYAAPYDHDMGMGSPACNAAPSVQGAAEAGKPTVGTRVDNALDGMRSTLDTVVGTVKDKLSDGGWQEAERRAEGTSDMVTPDEETITYNQITEVTPDPAVPEASVGTGVVSQAGMGTTMAADSDCQSAADALGSDYGPAPGSACVTIPHDDVTPDATTRRTEQIRHDIRTAADGEDEI